jgi:hypothetical protein
VKLLSESLDSVTSMTKQLARDLTHRISTFFVVRFRPFGESGAWLLGTGMNLSSGGLCFCFTAPARHCIGQRYEIRLTVNTPCGHHKTILIEAEVRWYAKNGSEIRVGLKVADPFHQRALASTLALHWIYLNELEGEQQAPVPETEC